jgi:tetratricopeptide (TPR) repeat protein
MVPSMDDHDGATLFTARARALRPSFTETSGIAELCARLDNLPLALELAAARVAIFSPEELLARLGKGVALKGGRDADPRQQTLEATIRWSYDLLAPAERRLFTRLAVFTGGCTYEAAEEVCAADVDTLQSLIDKSLVRSREEAGGSRYWMLETIREFAAAALEACGDADSLRLCHAEFFAVLAERADPHLRHGPDQQQWVERMAADYDNVRAAMTFALEHDLTLALRLVGRLAFFVWLRGGFGEAKAWLDAILPRAADQPSQLLGRAHEAAASIAGWIGDVAAQGRHADEAYAAFAAVSDEHGMADALRERGKTASAYGDATRGEAIYTELAELAARIGDRWNGAIALNNIGDLALQAGDWERVVDLCGRSSELRRELGDEWGMALALCNVVLAELELGRVSSAAKNLRVAIETSMKVNAKMVMAGCLEAAAELAVLRAQAAEGARLIGAASHLQEDLGWVRSPYEQAWFEQLLESVRDALGEDAAAAEIRRGWELSLDEAAAVALEATDGD